MSNRYKGGVLSATPPTTSSSAAPGIWTLEQQMQATAGTGWPFGGPFTYIEDVFSTYLYTGNSSTQTITNGIDLSTKGGLVWMKGRTGAQNHYLYDTVRGTNSAIFSDLTIAAQAYNYVDSFNTTGFTLNNNATNTTGNTYVSWTFREQPKFFDIVTYTGDGATYKDVTHSLGSTPGCIMVKCTSTGSTNWMVVHRSVVNQNLSLNLTSSASTINSETIAYGSVNGSYNGFFRVLNSLGSSDPNNYLNVNGNTYVAYLFAHNAGGFGLTGNDNVITCGSYTGIAYPTSLDVNVGFEPQWVMIKNATTASGWTMWDVMRGMSVVPAANTAQALLLAPNTSAAESNQPGIYPTATGFVVKNGLTSISGSGDTMIYIAIRRGPMKVPTVGTSVFSPVARSGTSGTATITAGFAPDVIWSQIRNYSQDDGTFDKLRGAVNLRKSSTGAEYAAANAVTAYTNTGVTVGADSDTGAINSSGGNYGNWIFQRAPSFFDEVCYTGTGTAGLAVTHNLGVVPELIIVKGRSYVTDWAAYSATLGNTQYLIPNTTAAAATSSLWWNNTSPTSTTFTLGNSSRVNNTSSDTYVAYLFASCPGVSKVGSYTGTATTKQVDCGFTAGSRFVLIKRTDSTGDWYVYDSARGIVSGNDPYLLLNSTAAEVTGTDYVDTYNAGFELSSTAPAGLNANGGTYIFLAIA